MRENELMSEAVAYPFIRMVPGRSATYPYFRSKQTGQVRVRGTFGSPEFLRHYAELLEMRERLLAGPDAGDETSFGWLIARYQRSAEYAALADQTQTSYARTLKLLDEALGTQPFKYTTRAMLKAVRDDYAATPRKAHKVKQMLSRLYSWADENDLVPDGFNPIAGVKRLKRKGGEVEIVPWSEGDIAMFLAAAPAHVVTPVLIALYTGQRREDVVTMTWQQWQSDELRVRQSKTHALLDLPCHPELKRHLEQLRAGAKVVSLTGPICLSASGKPFSADSLSGAVRRVVDKVPAMPRNRSMHGLRYAAAGRMEEGGAHVAAIEAVLGHRTFKMALKYAGARLRAQVGVAAMDRKA